MERDIENDSELKKCPKCKGKGIVKDEKGVHVCYDCLLKGKLDVHSKNIPDSKIKV